MRHGVFLRVGILKNNSGLLLWKQSKNLFECFCYIHPYPPPQTTKIPKIISGIFDLEQFS